MIYIIVTFTGIFAIWSFIYMHNVKKQRMNKIINNIIEYDKKKKAEQQKSRFERRTKVKNNKELKQIQVYNVSQGRQASKHNLPQTLTPKP